MSKITYATKVALNPQPSIPDENKVTDANMNEIKSVVNKNTPTGSIQLFGGNTAPEGWLICDGSAVSRTTYSDLFSIIGTTYGSGDGSTTFNIPNLKGRIPVGYDSSDTDFDTLGETGGEKEHQLTENELPNITGSIRATDNVVTNGTANNIFSNGTGAFRTQTVSKANNYAQSTVSGTANIGGGISLSFGNDEAHNNLQPYIVLNYIISY